MLQLFILSAHGFQLCLQLEQLFLTAYQLLLLRRQFGFAAMDFRLALGRRLLAESQSGLGGGDFLLHGRKLLLGRRQPHLPRRDSLLAGAQLFLPLR